MKLWIDISIVVLVVIIFVLGMWKSCDLGLYFYDHVKIEWVP